MAHQDISHMRVGASVPLSLGRSARSVSKAVSSESKAVSEFSVGEQIREVRKAKRIRQKVLARMVGISPGALTNFEKGRRRISLDWLQRISEALDTPMAYFLPDEKEQNRATPGDPRERRLLAAWRDLSKNEALKSDFLRLMEHLGHTRGIRKAKKHAS
jgi:transcriptional regulator with XRE-family HTH domain